MMKAILAQMLLVRGAKQVLTLRGPRRYRRGAELHDLAVIEDGSVLIRDGVIAQVGSTRRIENLKEIRGAAEITVSGAIVMPGLVDPAIYLNPARASEHGKRKKMTDFYNESLLLMRSCLQHGTLNAQVKVSSQTSDSRSELAVLRSIAGLRNEPIATTLTWRIGTLPQVVSLASEQHAATASIVARRNLAQFVEVPPSEEAANEKICAIASENRLGINLAWPGGSAKTLAGFLDRVHPHAVSCPLNLTSEECAVLSRYSVPAVFSPAKSIIQDRLSSAARELADMGAPICLASGYSMSEMPVFNMQLVIALAVLRLRLKVEEAISAVTINGAWASGLGNVTGSLEPGKRADLLVMNVPDYREIARRFGTNHVGMAIRGGKIAFNRTGWKVSAA